MCSNYTFACSFNILNKNTIIQVCVYLVVLELVESYVELQDIQRLFESDSMRYDCFPKVSKPNCLCVGSID